MFTAVLDACVLLPVALADTLLRAAEKGLYRPVWSPRITGEVRRAFIRVHPDLDPFRIEWRLQMAERAFPDASICGSESLINSIEVPDPGDRHVVATALASHADAIITANLRDFPARCLDMFGVQAVDPDAFLLDLHGLAPDMMRTVINDQAKSATRPALQPKSVLAALARAGAPEFAAVMEGKVA